MSQQISTAFKREVMDSFILLSQQMMSKFNGKVRRDPDLNGKSLYFDRLGEVAMQKRVGRHQQTQYQDTPHSRRILTPEIYDGADLIDSNDKLKAIADPTSDYAKLFVAGANRKMDDLIIAAATGSAYSVDEDEATTEVTLPAAQQISDGGNGMTLDLITETLEKFHDADVDFSEPKYFAIGPQQLRNMLNLEKLTSADYQQVQALVRGQINNALGFEWIVTTRLDNSAGPRKCFAWCRNGIGLGVFDDIKTRVDELPTMNYSTQVWVSMEMGATRIEDEKVVQVSCTET